MSTFAFISLLVGCTLIVVVPATMLIFTKIETLEQELRDELAELWGR